MLFRLKCVGYICQASLHELHDLNMYIRPISEPCSSQSRFSLPGPGPQFRNRPSRQLVTAKYIYAHRISALNSISYLDLFRD